MELKSANVKIEPREKAVVNSNRDKWKKYKEETGNDFLLVEAERLMTLAGEDPEIKAGVYGQLVNMLFEFPKDFQREYYLKAWGRKYKPLKVWKDEYKDQKELRKDLDEAENAPKDESDTTTLEEYGFYSEGNKYMFATNSGYIDGTNFLIEPLFHIYSMTNNRRLIRITSNTSSVLCDVPSDAIVSVEKFQNFIYSEGNFVIFIPNNLFKKLLLYIGEKFPKCWEIKTFGWQPEGFYAFADGCYNSIWQRVDDMGIVQHEDKNYFSPAFSKVYSELRTDDDIYENDRRFIYRATDVSIQDWSLLMQSVYSNSNNGQYGIAYLCAALFRSIIYGVYKIFPHMFLHGEKGSGKSQLGWSISNVFQHGTPPFNLSAGTDVAFFRWLARYRDVVIWYDEYTDAIDEKRFQALKSAYDGVGREKGKISKDSRTESDKINSAALISGQHLPQRDDNSLYTRSIVRFFVKPKDGFTKEATQNYDTLKKMEEAGLSQIITTLLDQRKIVESKFPRTFSDTFEYFKILLSEKKKNADDRILRNYTILASIVWVIQKETPVDIRIDPEKFRDMCLADAIEQTEKVNSSDALGTFWKIFSGILQDCQITDGDYDIKKESEVTTIKKSGGEKVSIKIKFDRETRVLYLDLDRVYQKYMESHRKVYGNIGLGYQTLVDYSHNHWSYIGLCSAHYFASSKGKNASAHMFNYDMLVDRDVLPETNSARDNDISFPEN